MSRFIFMLPKGSRKWARECVFQPPVWLGGSPYGHFERSEALAEGHYWRLDSRTPPFSGSLGQANGKCVVSMAIYSVFYNLTGFLIDVNL
jgi:hypothetical protein